MEQRIESSRLDSLEQRGSDVHVRVEGVLPCREFRKSSDGRLEVRCVRGDVAAGSSVSSLSSLRKRRTTHICAKSLMSPTPVDRVISLASTLYLCAASALHHPIASRAKRTCSTRDQSPPRLGGTGSQRFWPRKSPSHRDRTTSSAVDRPPVPGVPCISPSAAREGETHLDRHPVQLHPQHIMHERLVRPAMANHRYQIHVAIQNDQHCRTASAPSYRRKRRTYAVDQKPRRHSLPHAQGRRSPLSKLRRACEASLRACARPSLLRSPLAHG